MFGIRGMEWIIILVVILIIFGPSKIPALARSIGKAISEFKQGLKGVGDDIQGESNNDSDPEVKDEDKSAG